MIQHLAQLRDICDALLDLGAGIKEGKRGRRPTRFRGRLMRMKRDAEDEIARLTPRVNFPGTSTGMREEGRTISGAPFNND